MNALEPYKLNTSQQASLAGTLSQKPKLDILRSITEGYVSNTFVERKEEREYFVPLGSQITAIGEVILLCLSIHRLKCP